jgi:hypothetical protein
MQSNIGGAPQLTGLFKFTSLGNLVSNLWGVAFSIGAIAAFLFMGLGAITWITGGGEKAKVEEAKERITQGMVGLGILAVSYAVALLVQQFLGLNVFGGGSGGSGGGGGTGTCDGYANGVTQCRNQDCRFYHCNNGTWELTNQTPEPICMGNRSQGCYGVNPGFDPNATP